MVYIPYEFLGKVFFFLIMGVGSFLILGVTFTFLFVLYFYKTKKIIFPSFVSIALDIFYAPSKWLFEILKLDSSLIDKSFIEASNIVMLDKFKSAGVPRAIFIPHCMRNTDCKASFVLKEGYICTACGKCDIAKLKKAVEINHFKLYIVPGGSMVKDILTKARPKALIAVGCNVELILGLRLVMGKVPTQVVPLLKAGCSNTAVNIDKVIEKINLCGINYKPKKKQIK
ncbi:MAG: DUF116 domain-containing protein [DPANN group archaeon]|nr:DUF116 domain-containing protein [DPANN group archaeon]